MKNITDSIKDNSINEAIVTGDNYYVTLTFTQGDSYDIGQPMMWGFETLEEAKNELEERYNEVKSSSRGTLFTHKYSNDMGFLSVDLQGTLSVSFYEIREKSDLVKLYKNINRKKYLHF